MRYFNWLLRVVLFLALLGFAVKNDQLVTLHYFLNYEWSAPLILISLVFFAAGALVGVLAMFTHMLQQRREISRLQNDSKTKNNHMPVDEKLPPMPTIE